MTLSAVNIGDNLQVPGVSADIYNPDQLIAGNLKIVSDTVTLAAGTLIRGTVLGQVAATGNYVVSVKTANDGSQVPTAILADGADASLGPVSAGVYLTGEFNSNALTFDPSWTLAALKAAFRSSTIFLKNAVSAADPS
ncbi:head decoration protein [Undibacterium sp. MH2W]|uniref:head decoration protein n=1 Tax=Undibacterium sp. MH2W TaxID=3413044 RepID=UPI003BF426B2